MELVAPKGGTNRKDRAMAPRLGDLAGKKIGILINGKANAELLATETARLFVERHGCEVVDLFDKRNASKPCPAEHLQKLSEVCEFLITTVGD
jgi:hypothetical protein